jgi:hypothetical protein
VSHSLNETEALCRKAARGAGFSWGLSEEAGRAARWLESHGIAGTMALAGLLERNDGADYANLAPLTRAPIWCATGGQLCPIISGAALCDQANAVSQGRVVTLGPIGWPVLLMPFLDAISTLTHHAIKMTWDGVTVTVRAGNVRVDGLARLMGAAVETVRCTVTDDQPRNGLPTRTRATIRPDVLARLSTLAARTYAPATEASRIAGAGAGLTDND